MRRAEWLGSTGQTALVRCPCGTRLFLPRRRWRLRSFAVCDDCKAVILHASLEVLNPEEAEGFVEMVIAKEEEQGLLREGVEREVRRFVRAFDGQPEWLWSPATVKFVRAVRPKLELLGGPIGPADDGGRYGVGQEAAYAGEDVDEVPPDEEPYEEDDEEEDGDELDDAA